MFDKYSALFLSVVLLSSGSVMANQEVGSGSMQFSGVLLLEECVVDAGSAVQNIHIGDFNSSLFPQRDAVSPSKAFTIVLKNCTPSITGTKITFSGDVDSNNTDLLALSNSSTQTMATGIGIEILDSTGMPIKLNQETSQYALREGDNTLNFQLRYKSTSSQVTAGDASAVMYFDLVYR